MPDSFTFIGDELSELLAAVLRTRHIARPLEACDVTDKGQDVAQRMRQHGLTRLGVSERGRIIGAIDLSKISSENWSEQIETLCEEQVIDANAPLLELFERLKKRPWLLVRNNGSIDGFVSRSDLQRTPVRMLLFGLVSLFEMLLLELVQEYYSEEAIAQTLNANRLHRAQRLHTERQTRGEDLHLADCLQIADKRDLLLAAHGCTARLGFKSNKAANRFFCRVEQLRDRLVHANDLVAGDAWEGVLTTALQLAHFLEQAHHSRRAVGTPTFSAFSARTGFTA